MKRFHKKSLVLLIAVTLLLAFAVSGTVAFLVAKSGPVTNSFTPARVDTIIKETMSKGSKSSITVYNQKDDKNVPAYVRVAVVGYWVDEAGSIVEPWKLGNAYNSEDWELDDHFYYYKSVLEVDAETKNLLTAGGIKEPEEKPKGAHHLQVTVVHQAIQAAGWPKGVDTAQEAFAKAAENIQ